MSISFELKADTRDETGKGACRRMRRAGQVPAVLYGGSAPVQQLQVSHTALLRHLEHEAFYSHILTVKVGDLEEKAVLKAMQRHPSKAQILHLDLQRVSETEKIRMHVPLHFVGEDVAPGVKLGGGAVSHLVNDVEVLCLAKNLPEFIEVDLSSMELGQSIHLSDLKVPDGVEILALAHDAEHDQPVASVHTVRKAEVEEEGEVAEQEEAAPESDENTS